MAVETKVTPEMIRAAQDAWLEHNKPPVGSSYYTISAPVVKDMITAALNAAK